MRVVHTTGNRLRELRKEKGTPVREIANLIFRDQSLVSRYERGLTKIPDDAKLALAKHFGVTVDYLMGWDRELDEQREIAA